MYDTAYTIRVTAPASDFARYMSLGLEFSAGNLYSRTEFAGNGEYDPFDDMALDEIREAQYIVYSYNTPIAWQMRSGAWVGNCTKYSTTTSKHQRKIFDAMRELS